MNKPDDAMLGELAHLFHTPLTGMKAGADLLGRLVPDLRAKQGDPLKALIRRNSDTLQQRIEAILSLAVIEGESVVMRLTARDIQRIHCGTAEEVEIDIPGDEQNVPAPVVENRAPRNGVTVLVADDQKDLRALLATALHDRGYEVIEACNGAEALELITERRPEVLVLDGLMPKVGGFEVCRQAKGLDPAYQPKVLIVTAVYTKKSYQYEAAKFGADDFLTKPFEVELLLERVARLALAAVPAGVSAT